MEHPPGPVVGPGPLGEGEPPRVTEAPEAGVGPPLGDTREAGCVELGPGALDDTSAAQKPTAAATAAITAPTLRLRLIRRG
jgi:hypothetical protein